MARTTRQEWAKRVERWQSSDLTASEFATEIGVNPRTLSYWKWILKNEVKAQAPKRTKRARKAKVAFTEVMTAAPPPGALTEPADAGVEIRVQAGWSIRVTSSFDEMALRRVLACMNEATA